MNGKPVYTLPSKTIINFDSGFKHKLLCDGPTFSTGTACAYSCSFCYVPAIMRKSPQVTAIPEEHEDVVIRRQDPLKIMRDQLVDKHRRPKFKNPLQTKVIYASPLVDVAANMELVRETIDCCKVILELTPWHIRLLSKSNLLPKIAEELSEHRDRMIYGVSTGTLGDGLASAFEAGTPLVSKRIQSIHWLQDNGFRTFGMICPSLPQEDYKRFSDDIYAVIRAHKMEHVWAEVLNVRGKSMENTVNALRAGGFDKEAHWLSIVSKDKSMWESYARKTFTSHANNSEPGKLRFLQYVTNETREWWEGNKSLGAVLL